MAKGSAPKLDNFQLTAKADVPDFRDYIYEPALVKLKSSLRKPAKLNIRDQGREGACTGFGLAAAIDIQVRQEGSTASVSARMLYEMARRYDEWKGEAYEGSSCRGAIKGWYNMGVCSESLYPYDPSSPGVFTVEAAKDARRNTVGAYYRLGERISDYHAALTEVGVIYCSAIVHDGWREPDAKTGKIEWHKKPAGGHAFAIVGYNSEGFWIQNSWGKSWGKGGTAVWTYEDWLTNIQDAWVFRMGLPTPQIWHLPVKGGSEAASVQGSRKPTRAEIAGHFLHIDDGHFHEGGRYWSNLNDVKQTAQLVAESDKYDHLLFYAHGGLNSPEASACRIAAMRDTFKANRIYPYHLMYDTGLLEELKDVIQGGRTKAEGRAGGLLDWIDWLIEQATRVPGRALWREMKAGARAPFDEENAGSESLAAFVSSIGASNKPKKLHLIGHSTGMILLSHLLQRLALLAPGMRIESVSLLAPAGTLDLFGSHIQPLIKQKAPDFHIREATIYNLNSKLEKDDNVAKAYNKSLLYLVSKAFEDETPARILGMQKYSKIIERRKLPNLTIHYSEGKTPGARITESESHGGFDNDPLTMNHILRRILGKKPVRLFTNDSLNY
jgi:pimeloyl-ACP methyl ester carboxylesterase